MTMDLKHKHWALIVVGGLIVVFIALVAWFTFGKQKVLAPSAQTATSTAATTTTAAVATTTSSAHLSEDATYYTIDLTYPAATPLTKVSADANEAAVDAMKSFAETTASQFKTDGNFANLTHDDVQMQGLDQSKEALSSEYKVYTGARTISYVYTIYEDTHGAHPNTYFKTFTFDTQSGRELSLADLFVSGYPYLSHLSGRAQADLPAIINKQSNGGGADTDEIHLGTAPTEDNFANFYISGNTLVFVFAPYQVGPYALGTVLDPIPLAQLSDGLKPDYLPK